jgi:hypothetical protein
MSQPVAENTISTTPQHSRALKNLGRHLDRTFELWNIKNPGWNVKIQRSFIFTGSLLLIALWPQHDLAINFLILSVSWLLLALTERSVPFWLLMLHMQFNIAWLFQMVNLSLRVWS